MIAERFSILNFKNIEEVELEFSPKMNCLFGNNGMGKTNLLEALYYLSFTKSATGLPDSQIVRHGADFCLLQAAYLDGDRTEEISCGLRPGRRKTFKRNKKEYERMSEHIGLLPLVMVSPADASLIQGGSDERRRFVDMVVSQYDKIYLHTLMRYNKALQQRNALLRDDSRPPDNALLDVIDARMAEDGRFIYSRRREFIDGFLPLFIDFYRRISSDGEQVDLRYESHFANCDDPMSIFISRRERDRILGFTSAGAHKDDFLLMLGDCLIRKIGSEGQNKTCLIALKLAQFACLASRGTTPILLLDDVFDKLDANRVEQIISLVAGDGFGQIFITDTNRKYLDEILAGMNHDYRLFHVENGKFSTL